MWEISYPLKDESGAIIVATTRPETMFGDVAIAVHPSDHKYSELIGKKVVVPLTCREIPIIADDKGVIGVAGICTDERVCIDKNTEKVLLLKIYKC